MSTIIKDAEQLGYAQVQQNLVPQCLQFFQRHNDPEIVAVVFDDGRLLASLTAWQQHFAELQELIFAARKYCQIQHCLTGSAEMIREILADADGQQRSMEVHGVDANYGESLAKQTLIDIVTEALELGATDIHLRLAGKDARIAYRIDGLLCFQGVRSRVFVTEVVAAALNTQSDDCFDVFDERQITAASITLNLPAPYGQVRIRSQKSPCRDGFTVTLRLQRSFQLQLPSLAELGFAPPHISLLGDLMQQSIGLILISGPTGHGKTTTLAAMNTLVPNTRKVISLEDPIEIIQPTIEQKFVANTAEGDTFSSMLKVVLREDPDLVEVSEIRDIQTAKSAVSAALTGHLVASTIHANDAIGIIPRLLDIGLSARQLSQPGLIAGLIAQRLLPKLCCHCRQQSVFIEFGTLWEKHTDGCEHCNYRGVVGRVVVSEIILPSIDSGVFIREQDFAGWRKQLQARGWLSLAAAAEVLVKQGIVALSDARKNIPGMRLQGRVFAEASEGV